MGAGRRALGGGRTGKIPQARSRHNMSFLLTRIRRVLADPPEEKFTHHVNVAISAHWKTLFESNTFLSKPPSDELRATLAAQQKACADAEQKHLAYVTAQLALWELKRKAFDLDATLGGLPGAPGPLHSADYGTHWILFDWKPPATGGPVWGYRVERSTDNLNFYVADMGVEPEITLVHQPQNVKIYYRVVAFNGWGDGPPSSIFGIQFDPELVDVAKRRLPQKRKQPARAKISKKKTKKNKKP